MSEYLPRVAFFAEGIPRPQGSKTALQTRAGRPFVVETGGPLLRVWRKELERATPTLNPPMDGPVAVWLHFYLPPPGKPRWPFPAKVPDLDKLVRAVLDQLTGRVFADDRLVVWLHASKEWGDPPGVNVAVRAIGTEMP